MAPVLVNVTSGQLSGNSGRRRLLQTSATEQPTVSFNLTFPSAPASASITSLQAWHLLFEFTLKNRDRFHSHPVACFELEADVSTALTAHIGSSTPVQISFSPAAATKGVAFTVSMHFPPNNQLSSTVSYSTSLAAQLANDIETNANTVFASVIAKDGPITVSGTQTTDQIVQAVAGSNLSPAPPLPTPVPSGPGSPGQVPGSSPAASSPPPPASPAAAQSSPPGSPATSLSPPQSSPASPTATQGPPPTTLTGGATNVQVAAPYTPGASGTPTLQSTVTAMITLLKIPSSTPPDATWADVLASDVTAYVGGAARLVTAVSDSSGPNLAINLTVVYPTNSQLSGTPDAGSLQASSLADGLRSAPASVFLGLIAKTGAIQVSNIQTITKVVQSGGAPIPSAPLVTQTPAASLPPPANSPTPVSSPVSSPVSTSSSTPISTPVSTPSTQPTPTPTPSPVPAASPVSTASPTPASPTVTPAAGPAPSGGVALQPTVTFLLTFPGLAPGAVTDPRSLEVAVAQDIEAFLGTEKLSKVTELPLNGGPNWALNVTVSLVPDGQNAPAASDVQTLVRVVGGSFGSAESAPASGSFTATPPTTAGTPVASTHEAVPKAPTPPTKPAAVPAPSAGATPTPTPAATKLAVASPVQQPTMQTVTFSLSLTDISASGHATDAQGYITKDIDAYVGASLSTAITFMEDSTGSNLVLNVSVAYPGSAPRTSQDFANAQLSAEALATAINSNPASVFKTLIAQKVHGKAYNVAIAGPSAGTATVGAPSGAPPVAAPGPGAASSQPPAGAPSAAAAAAGQLALTFTAAFPASAQNAALNLSAALQTNAAAVLRPVALKHGAISISGVLVTQKATDISGAIESYAGPMAAPSTGTNPYPAGIAASNASYKQQQPGNATSAAQLYAINMQFSNGQAQSDKINNILLLSLGGAGSNGGKQAAPTPDQFVVQTSRGVPSAITAIVPYAPQPYLYLIQVSTPADYTGPVTVTYDSAGDSASLSFTIMIQLTVKVTACSFSA
ncbi:hypothetical protein COCOBI_18-0210 [Coccomyxa sp. Obi]|nr:hypothetical protein COCOBI_18-0210 [Coccomyxa sp. Obi]